MLANAHEASGGRARRRGSTRGEGGGKVGVGLGKEKGRIRDAAGSFVPFAFFTLFGISVTGRDEGDSGYRQNHCREINIRKKDSNFERHRERAETNTRQRHGASK